MNGMLLITIGGVLALCAMVVGQARQGGGGGGEPARAELGEAGSIALPDGFSHEQQQGIDTTVGRIERDDPPLQIGYDIGGSAGRYANPARQADYAWFTHQSLGERQAFVAMRHREGQRLLVVTIEPTGQVHEMDPHWPANFSAQINDERDVAQALLIAMSYQPAE